MNRENLITRINILLQGGTINEDTYKIMMLVVRWLDSKKSSFSNDAHVETFFTHLAMAVQRDKNGESLTEFDEYDLDEVKNGGLWGEVNNLYDEMQGIIKTTFTPGESVFLKIYLNLMLIEK